MGQKVSGAKSSIPASGNKLAHFLQFTGNLAHLSVLQHSEATAARYKYEHTGHGMSIEYDHIQTPWNLNISGPCILRVT